jgi:hypothetical protein
VKSKSEGLVSTFMKKWLGWIIVGGPVLVYAIGKLLSR